MAAMIKPVIAVDVDEVLAPLHDVFFLYHNKEYGTDFPLDDPKRYFIHDFTGDSHEQTIEKLRLFTESDEYLQIEPLEQSVHTIQRLADSFDLKVLTSRQHVFQESTKAWLLKHFPEAFREVHFTNYIAHKGLQIPKSELCKELGAGYLIDDSLANVTESATAGIECVLFGLYPWNQSQKLPIGVTRCKDWKEVEAYFDERRS